MYAIGLFSIDGDEAGSRLTYRDALDREFGVFFSGPDHHERCRAYMSVLSSSGVRIQFLPGSDDDMRAVVEADAGGWLNLDQREVDPAGFAQG